MMHLRRTLILLATPLVIGSVGFLTIHQVNAQGNLGGNQPTQRGEMKGRRGQHPPDFATAANELGVTEEALKTALGVPENPPQNGDRPPRPDFAGAASELGVTEDALKTALGVPEGGFGRGERGESERPRHDFAAVASELGVTEEALKTALKVPENCQQDGQDRRHERPDLTAAASELGVTEDALRTALGVPENGAGRGQGQYNR